MLHNFIRLNQLNEDYFYDDDVDVVQEVNDNAEEEVVIQMAQWYCECYVG
jgi:hypothetical protein